MISERVLDFLGQELDDRVGQEIATGRIDPTTKEPFSQRESLTASQSGVVTARESSGDNAFQVLMKKKDGTVAEKQRVVEKENDPGPREKSNAFSRLFRKGLKRRLLTAPPPPATVKDSRDVDPSKAPSLKFAKYAFAPKTPVIK